MNTKPAAVTLTVLSLSPFVVADAPVDHHWPHIDVSAGLTVEQATAFLPPSRPPYHFGH